MTSAAEAALIGVLSLTLAVVSALAGALAWRCRHLERELKAMRPVPSEPAVATSGQGREKAPFEVAAPAPLAPQKPPRRDPGKPPSGPTLIAVPDLGATMPAADSAEARAELSRKYAPLWDLADAGVEPRALARAVGQPVGQVELILGLRSPRAGDVGPEARGEPR